MSRKICIICIIICLIQNITGQYITKASSNVATPASNANPNLLANRATKYRSNAAIANSLAASATGGAKKPAVFTVTSTSPVSPVGLSVYADNIVLEGPLAVTGQLPYLGVVSFEGSLDTAGQGVAGCACGASDDSIGIVSEDLTGIGSSV